MEHARTASSLTLANVLLVTTETTVKTTQMIALVSHVRMVEHVRTESIPTVVNVLVGSVEDIVKTA